MTPRRSAGLALAISIVGAAIGGGVLALAAPLPTVLGATRLAVFVVLVSGAWITLGRLGLVDLGAGAVAGLGAYAGGVGAALAGAPAVAGLGAGALAGMLGGAAMAAIGARVGRTLSALTSLAAAAGIVALLRAWTAAGGAAGFHAVPLLTPGDRTDLVALLAVLGVALAAAGAFARSRQAAAAAVAVGAAEVSAALGRRPALDAGVGGAVGGALLGLGGAAGAVASGSAIPAAYGLPLSAALALAVLVGGRGLAGVPLGALIVWGPGILLPGARWVGDAPLLVTGTLGIAHLALRPGGLVPGRRPPPVLPAAASPQPRMGRQALELRGAPLLGDLSVALRVEPGEVVALVGPNGAGKSTLLARIAGQLDDGGGTYVGGRRAARGPVARGRAGIARTWQRPPETDATDALVVVAGDAAAASAAAWANDLLGGDAGTPAGAQLVQLAARRPSVALLDEPAAALDHAAVGRLLRGLADGGAAVLVVEHRRELAAAADRVLGIDEVAS